MMSANHYQMAQEKIHAYIHTNKGSKQMIKQIEENVHNY